jgi:hypothetical protein
LRKGGKRESRPDEVAYDNRVARTFLSACRHQQYSRGDSPLGCPAEQSSAMQPRESTPVQLLGGHHFSRANKKTSVIPSAVEGPCVSQDASPTQSHPRQASGYPIFPRSLRKGGRRESRRAAPIHFCDGDEAVRFLRLERPPLKKPKSGATSQDNLLGVQLTGQLNWRLGA